MAQHGRHRIQLNEIAPGMPHFIEQTMNQRKLMHLNSSLNQINPSIIDTQSVR
jgi:hypothetical protein